MRGAGVKLGPKRLGRAIWEAVEAWWNDGGVRRGASIAFYSMFALAPLLVIAIAIAGAVFGEEATRGQIVGQIQALVGQQAAHAIQGMIEAASQTTQSTGASVLGFATLLLGASAVFVELRKYVTPSTISGSRRPKRRVSRCLCAPASWRSR